MMMGGGCRLRQKQVMVMLYGQRIQAVHDHVRIFMPTKRATTMITSFTHNEILNRTTFWLLSCCFGYFFVLFWCFFLCNNSTATLCSSPFEISSQTGAGAILYYYLWMEHLFHIWTDPIGEYTPHHYPPPPRACDVIVTRYWSIRPPLSPLYTLLPPTNSLISSEWMNRCYTYLKLSTLFSRNFHCIFGN